MAGFGGVIPGKGGAALEGKVWRKSISTPTEGPTPRLPAPPLVCAKTAHDGGRRRPRRRPRRATAVSWRGRWQESRGRSPPPYGAIGRLDGRPSNAAVAERSGRRWAGRCHARNPARAGHRAFSPVECLRETRSGHPRTRRPCGVAVLLVPGVISRPKCAAAGPCAPDGGVHPMRRRMRDRPHGLIAGPYHEDGRAAAGGSSGSPGHARAGEQPRGRRT